MRKALLPVIYTRALSPKKFLSALPRYSHHCEPYIPNRKQTDCAFACLWRNEAIFVFNQDKRFKFFCGSTKRFYRNAQPE